MTQDCKGVRTAARLAALTLAAALAMAAPARAQSKNEYDLNDIGHRGVGEEPNLYSLDKEVAIGKSLAQQVEATAHIVTDPTINEYINRITQNLVRNSDAKVPFTVRVVESSDVNAASLPGGYFFVNTGLILAADNESELAGVMAHEIAHVAARHGTRNATKAQIMNYATIPLIFVAGPIGLLGRTGASIAVPMTYLKFDRSDETEADFLGLQYAYLAGYDPQSFIAMFEKLKAQEKKQPGTIAKAFETHPPTPQRIQASEKEIAKVLPPRPQYVLNTSEFDQVKARLALLEHQTNTANKLNAGDKPSLRRPDSTPAPGSDQHPVLQRRDDGGGGL